MDQPLYHLVRAADLDARLTSRGYEPPSLAVEGFVHLSTAAQLPDTYTRFYADKSDVHYFEIDPLQLTELRWEDTHGHGTFPHHYAPLPVAAMTDLGPYQPAT